MDVDAWTTRISSPKLKCSKGFTDNCAVMYISKNVNDPKRRAEIGYRDEWGLQQTTTPKILELGYTGYEGRGKNVTLARWVM